MLICTRDRARMLAEAIETLRASVSARPWELVVVDNASTDDTADVIASAARTFPVPVRYVREPRLGKSFALNTGLRIVSGRIILFGDDDQHFDPGWIDAGCRPLLEDPAVHYSGGPVVPLLGGARPAWLDLAHAEMRAPLGLFDYGPDPFVFEERHRIPGGGNMAIRAALAAQIGGFREDLGRRGRSLLGQEQAEFFARSRAAGARGVYVPGMVVYHQVPPERLRRRYFTRWWYWKGVAHARWQTASRHGIPRFVYSEGARALLALARATAGRAPARLLPLLRLAYLAGYAVESRRAAPAAPSAPAITPIRSRAEV
ncbi:MAG: glycosyltransferase [Vicinamibacterales bacterium]